jgi:hypothetical protein
MNKKTQIVNQMQISNKMQVLANIKVVKSSRETFFSRCSVCIAGDPIVGFLFRF